MYINNPNYGLKLIDFVEQYDNDNIENDLIEFVYNFLKSSKKYFFVSDDEIFKNFCELFALNFYSRTINFDTTLELKLKIQNILLLNKMKYKKIYNASLMDLNPLITFKEETTTNENENGKNTNNGISENIAKSNSETELKNLRDKTTYNDLRNRETFENYKESSKTISDYKKNYETLNKKLFSDTPQSNVIIDDLFNNNNYVSNATNDLTEYKDKPNSQDITSTDNSITGIKDNTQSGNFETEKNGITTNKGDVSNNSKVNNVNNFENSKEYKTLKTGFNGSEIELLEKFVKIVFDVNKEIINDVENAHIFSEYFL